jgi:hypothetical protein
MYQIPSNPQLNAPTIPYLILQIILKIIQKPVSLQLLQLPPLPQAHAILPLRIQYYFRMFVSIETSSVVSVDLGLFEEDYVACEGIEKVDVTPYYNQQGFVEKGRERG